MSITIFLRLHLVKLVPAKSEVAPVHLPGNFKSSHKLFFGYLVATKSANGKITIVFCVFCAALGREVSTCKSERTDMSELYKYLGTHFEGIISNHTRGRNTIKNGISPLTFWITKTCHSLAAGCRTCLRSPHSLAKMISNFPSFTTQLSTTSSSTFFCPVLTILLLPCFFLVLLGYY